MEKGYRVGRLDSLDGRFKCTYCSLLLRDPMQGDCGHRYCKNCVQIKYNAAVDQGQQSLCTACDPSEQCEISPDRVYQDNAIKREINKSLQVHCPNESCTIIMLLSQLLLHIPVCDFKPQACDRCGQLVASASMLVHKSDSCPKRPVSCERCKEDVAFDAMESHLASTCVGNTEPCQFCLARVKDDDASRDAHQRSDCPAGWHDTKKCPFGCEEMAEGWREHRDKCVTVHVDRLLAKSCQKGQQADSKPQSSASKAMVMVDSVREIQPPVSAASEAELVGQVNYDELASLKERAKAIERRLDEIIPALPAGALSGSSGDQGKAKKYLGDLHAALGQGQKLNELLGVIKKQFDDCYEKIRQYEQRMQKDLEKKLDIERKHQELVKLLAYKEMKILDLERRVEILEHAGYDGVLIWKITDVRRRKEEAREGKVCSIYSPPFYTGKAGYKMCGRLYLNGDGAGKNSHISLFFVIMRGSFDALLPWPFSKKVSMMLLDQNFEEHVIDAFKPDTSSSSFKRPTTDMNIASGCPLFMPLNDFENGSRGYVKDDTMFIKFIVDKSDLPT